MGSLENGFFSAGIVVKFNLEVKLQTDDLIKSLKFETGAVKHIRRKVKTVKECIKFLIEYFKFGSC